MRGAPCPPRPRTSRRASWTPRRDRAVEILAQFAPGGQRPRPVPEKDPQRSTVSFVAARRLVERTTRAAIGAMVLCARASAHPADLFPRDCRRHEQGSPRRAARDCLCDDCVDLAENRVAGARQSAGLPTDDDAPSQRERLDLIVVEHEWRQAAARAMRSRAFPSIATCSGRRICIASRGRSRARDTPSSSEYVGSSPSGAAATRTIWTADWPTIGGLRLRRPVLRRDRCVALGLRRLERHAGHDGARHDDAPPRRSTSARDALMSGVWT